MTFSTSSNLSDFNSLLFLLEFPSISILSQKTNNEIRNENIIGNRATLAKLIPLVFIAVISSLCAILLIDNKLPSSIPRGAVFINISGSPNHKYLSASAPVNLLSNIQPVTFILSANKNTKKNILIPRRKLLI